MVDDAQVMAALDDSMAQARTDALNVILTSESIKKIVVAGPGTGKTHTYRALIDSLEGSILAITFLNSLVVELQDKLGDKAEVNTFHGLCKSLLHRNSMPGLTFSFNYYPALVQIFETDLSVTGERVKRDEIEAMLMNLDGSNDIIQNVIRSGDYYDAAGHTDGVYRVYLALNSDSSLIPKYDQVVVDEYQDFSRLEVRMINLLASKSPVLIVGDDDQALYSFRQASAKYIRELWNDPEYEKFVLPFCSRCTSVLVSAVNRVVEVSVARGPLNGRIDKDFFCYLPDKRLDSEKFPQIKYARCSTQSDISPIAAKYVLNQIRSISSDDIVKSNADGNPTVLIIGPKNFTTSLYKYFAKEEVPNVFRKTSDELTVEVVDGFGLLFKNSDSRLGWRILLECQKPRQWKKWIRASIVEGEELSEQLNDVYKSSQLDIVSLLKRYADAKVLSKDEIAKIETALGLGIEEIKNIFRPTEIIELIGEEEVPLDNPLVEVNDPDRDFPSIIITSLLGAKGLQAEHVFVIGFNDGHFPKVNASPSDDEVCKLIVALTRARKSCTILSCNNLSGNWLDPSVFVDWLDPYLEKFDVTKSFFDSQVGEP